MTRQIVSLSVLCGLVSVLSALGAAADELPLRKAGLWEMKIVKTGSSLPDLAIQQCTDATTDKDMSNSVSPMAKQICSKQDVQKTATGYVVDSVCSMAGISVNSHAEITGDFNSAYTIKTTSHRDGGPATMPRDTTNAVEAKWLGDCKPDQKAGDIVMPGGFKMNIKDAEKLKGLIQPAK